jgi:cytidylate kinase
LREFIQKALSDPTIDHEIDERTKRLAREDNFVIDARLAFQFIPRAINIFLKVDPRVAARRIWGDLQAKKRGGESELKSEGEVLGGIQQRLKIETELYKKHYNVDYLNEHHYDFVLDTAGLTVEQAVQRVMDFVLHKK